MRQLPYFADLLPASGGDPLVAHLLPYVVTEAPMLALDGAVLFVYDYWDAAGVQLIGPPEPCAALLVAADSELPSDYAAVPEESVALLGERFRAEETWRFRWTERRPDAPSLAGRWLDDSELGEVDALLESSFPDASSRPGNRHVKRWAGIRDEAGRLIATAADCSGRQIGFMASVASDISQRRGGLGLAMTTWMTHALLDEHSRVGLWQYSSNTVATALYDKLGYRDEHRYAAGIFTSSPAGGRSPTA